MAALSVRQARFRPVPSSCGERRCCRLVLVLAGLVGAPVARAQEIGPMVQPSHLVNGSFEDAGPDGVAVGWQLDGAGAGAGQDRGTVRSGRVSQRLSTPAGGSARFWQDATLEADGTYLLRVWVKSLGRVVARMGPLVMSYHRQGEWQQLVGLARADGNGALRVSIDVTGLDGRSAVAWIDGASLVRTQSSAPSPRRAGRIGVTRLLEQGQSAASIVYPSEGEEWQRLAESLRDAISARLGVALPIVADTEATTPGPPVLRQAYRDRHLILLGRLGVNRAMWPATNRFLCAVDGYYPGGNGYVVRTAADVLHNRRNHIILGGSTRDGAERAVEHFTKQLSGPDVPWLVDVELGGRCLAVCRERDELWASDADNSILPPIQAGYGTVRRWYENAMGYYWTGWDSYRQRAVDHLELVLKDNAHTHHYLVEFLVRTWTMLAESDVFTEAQREGLDRLIANNFREFLLGPDLGWMTTFSPPYDNLAVTNRHQIAPWYADLAMADFLHHHLVLDDTMADLVAFRRSEKHAVFRHLVSERWAPSPPGSINGSACHEEIVAAMFRYALENERYEFFEKGHARRALALDFVNHRSGNLVRPGDRQDHRLLLGILAHYYRDRKYLSLLEQLPYSEHPTGPFQGRYVCGIHKYVPGTELAPAPLDAFSGLRLPESMPHQRRHLARYGHEPYRKVDVPPGEALDFVAFRGGFGPDDDYLAISGVAAHCTPGAILHFSAHDTAWLFGVGERYFDQNAVHVLRADRRPRDPQPYASVATLDYHTEWDGGAALGLTLTPFCGTAWKREIVWLRPSLFVVRDRLTALEPGRYEVTVNWHPNGGGKWERTHWTGYGSKARLRITPVGRDLRLITDGAVRFSRSAELAAGASCSVVTVIQSVRGAPPQ